jgi:histidyl-tRNA synthetase
VVNKEMYMVTTQHGETGICLRPEATASTMRAFFNNSITTQPWNVFSHGPMFRHERPQKGRYRQFEQITIESIGAQAIAYDAQLIGMLDHFFQKLHITNYALLINYLGSRDDREQFKQKLATFFDKQTTLPPKIAALKDTNILRTFDLKDPASQELMQKAPVLLDHLSHDSQQEWEQLQNFLDQTSVSYSVDPTLVRGLDYYNKTVFEFVSSDLGAQSAFCAGGRYDDLAPQLGAKEAVPSIGAAMGIDRILHLLEHNRDRLQLPAKPTLHAIIPLDPKQHALALICAYELRRQNLHTDVLFDGTSIKSTLRKANKMDATYVLMIGADEQAQNYITVKDMANGEEKSIPQAELVSFLQQ